MQISSSGIFFLKKKKPKNRTRLILHRLILFIVQERTDHFIYMISLMLLSPGLFYSVPGGVISNPDQVSVTGQTPGDHYATGSYLGGL